MRTFYSPIYFINELRGGMIMQTEIETVQRTVEINGAVIRIKSIFNGKITLEKALLNIIKQRLTQSDKNGNNACM